MRDEGDGEAGREGEESKLATDNRHNNNALKAHAKEKDQLLPHQKVLFQAKCNREGRTQKSGASPPTGKKEGREGW